MQCVTFLRLLIRRPSSQNVKPFDHTEDDEFEFVTVCASLAASILSAHKNIRDNNLKHCFPFSHYLTSATMVMIGLVTREPGLKRRYRDLILAATQSLRTYCHTIWVSGKMMRWVSRLSLLVQQILNDGLPDDRSGQSPDGTRDLDLENRAINTQQPTPQSDSYDLLQNPVQRKTSIDGNLDETYGPSADNEQSSRRPEGRETIACKKNHNKNSIPSDRHSGKSDQNLSDLWMTMGNGGGNQSPELPGWAMSDFNFEAIINGNGLNSEISATGLSTIPGEGNMSVIQVGSVDLDRDINDSMFGNLESNGVFNLDNDMDQAIMRLRNSTNSGY